MHILVFSPFYPPHAGGLESHSDEFNKYLSKAGVKIMVFTPQLPYDAPISERRHQGVEILRFPAFELFHNYPLPKFWHPLFWRQWHSLQVEYDLVISRTRFFFSSLMAWWYAQKRRLPRIHVEHGSDFAKFNGRAKTLLAKMYDHLFGSFVLRTADRVIANSQASATFVCTLANQNSCQVIYRGVEKEKIFAIPAFQQRASSLESGVRIGCVGRLIDGKGVNDLLEALAALPIKDFHCVIIGDGPERKKLEKRARHLGLEKKIRLLGHQPWPTTIGYLKTFDIFINPSHTEGIPTAVIEAALCRKAIIATDVGGTSEIIRDHEDGFLVPPKKHRLLAEKLSLLLENETLRRSLGEKAFRAVEHKFSWEDSAQKYLTLFNELLQKK